jgi:hypothetical protein
MPFTEIRTAKPMSVIEIYQQLCRLALLVAAFPGSLGKKYANDSGCRNSPG